jgi:hypothetical protein
LASVARWGDNATVKPFLKNMALTAATLVVFGALCEFVVFRFVLRASDIPRNAYIDDVIRFEPNQSGVYRIRNEIAARYRINAQGWNSAHESYAVQHPGDRERIAVIGDSYVEAFQVDFDQSLAEVLERCSGSEVYRFAISGSPLSQYLHMIEHAAVRYSPDRVVVVVVHNDFTEAYKLQIGKYTRSFALMSIENGVIARMAPEPHEPPSLLWARGSATYRYMVDRMQVNVAALKQRVLMRDGAGGYAANVAQSSIDDEWESIRLVTEYFFVQLNRLGQRFRFQPVVVVDGVRRAIYENVELEPQRLNRLCVEMGAAHGVVVIDLHTVFSELYVRDGRKFEFDRDGHWNAYAHEVVGSRLCSEFQRQR